MDFKTDIFALDRQGDKKFNLIGTRLPNSNDIYFRAKQEELFEMYQSARIFMYETETDDWNHWFQPADENNTDDEEVMEYFRLFFRANFYEAALFYYNAIVDVSWTLCYVAIEYACNRKGERINISGIKPIEEAAALLRSAEKNVTTPTAEDSPFQYLKVMCCEFDGIIDTIIEFWNAFSDTDIRERYNYCKHKGKPAYSEMEALKPGKLMGVYIEDKANGRMYQMASDVSDVRYTCSLEGSIEELRKFDDECLYPYIEGLFNSIEEVLQPSPMI